VTTATTEPTLKRTISQPRVWSASTEVEDLLADMLSGSSDVATSSTAPWSIVLPHPIPALLQLKRLCGEQDTAPHVDAVARASKTILALAIQDQANGRTSLPPNVTSSSDGEVVFEWWNKGKKLTIYVGSSLVGYVKVWGPDVDSDMEADDVTEASRLAAVWDWLAAS
jgi:hypothetical protein